MSGPDQPCETERADHRSTKAATSRRRSLWSSGMPFWLGYHGAVAAAVGLTTTDIQCTACQQLATQWGLRADTSDANTRLCLHCQVAVNAEACQRDVECPQHTAGWLLVLCLQRICFTRSVGLMRCWSLQILVSNNIRFWWHRTLKFTRISMLNTSKNSCYHNHYYRTHTTTTFGFV